MEAHHITYIKDNQKWLYLAIVLDLYSRKIIGWSMDTHMESSLVCQALTMAMLHRGYPSKMIVHSDRGSQYYSDDYQTILTAYGLTCSMSCKRNCWNNAVAESFFHTLKTEWTYQHKLENIEQTKSMILWYIEAYYNRVRKHSYLNYLSPIQFENRQIK